MILSLECLSITTVLIHQSIKATNSIVLPGMYRKDWKEYKNKTLELNGATTTTGREILANGQPPEIDSVAQMLQAESGDVSSASIICMKREILVD